MSLRNYGIGSDIGSDSDSGSGVFNWDWRFWDWRLEV